MKKIVICSLLLVTFITLTSCQQGLVQDTKSTGENKTSSEQGYGYSHQDASHDTDQKTEFKQDEPGSHENDTLEANAHLHYIYPSAAAMCDAHELVVLSEARMNELLAQIVTTHQFEQREPHLLMTDETTSTLNMMDSGDEMLGTVVYRTSSPQAKDEVYLFAVGIGTAANDLYAAGLIWHEDNEWHWQPYPNATSAITEKRREILQDRMCAGGVTRIYQDGAYAAAVVAMGWQGTGRGEEVHLLKREEGRWHLLWAPVYDDWSADQGILLPLIHAQVEFQNGIDSFTVQRYASYGDPETIYTEEWRRVGDEYILVQTTKESF